MNIENLTPTGKANYHSAQAGIPVYEAFQEETKHPQEVNNQLLFQILQNNKDTEFGKIHNFADIHTVEEFQSRMPVSVYDNFAPYIERMIKGESDILVHGRPDHFNTTSGTVGAKKYIPLTDEQTEVFLKYNKRYIDGFMAKKLGYDWINGRAFCTAEGTSTELPNGITTGAASSRMVKFIQGGAEALDAMMRTLYTSPVEAGFAGAENDSKYIHTRFALAATDITGIVTGFFGQIVLLLQYIENNWETLVNDIETGTISENIQLTAEFRMSLQKKIQPMPERAAELRAIFSKGFEEPFMPRIWPHIQYISGVGGDGFAIYDKKIKERYSGGLLKNIYSGITASEGLWSVPVELENEDSALAAGSAFMEFLPIEAGDDFSQCVTMDKVELGKIYELIITNHCGLYRYRMSDAIKVTGFYNKTPMVRFMYRVNKTINLITEKTTEHAIAEAVQRTVNQLGLPIIDYSLYPDADAEPPQYVFFMEVGKEMDADELEQAREVLSENLQQINPSYENYTKKKSLQPLSLSLLQPETYLLYRDIMVYRGTSASQLKPVHVISNYFQKGFFYKLIEKPAEAK